MEIITTARLSSQEWSVVRKRHYLHQRLTFQAIGKSLDLSPEHTVQINQSALRKLRRAARTVNLANVKA